MSRILVGVFFLGLSLSVGPLGSAEGRGDGTITFYTYYLKEQKAIRYREGDKILPEGLQRIQELFRSRDSNQTLPIDPRLVDLIDQIEDHFGVRQIEVISGYRSTAFNKDLKATGHNVANESFHTKGMAADIHLDEIDEKTLRDYALSLGIGGVGFYPSLDFVHVDVGPVRTWGEEGPRKAWIGEKNEACPVTLTVSPTRMIGTKGLETLRVEGGAIEPDVTIEFFDHGEWKTVGKVDARTPLHNQMKAFENLPWGKFRLKANVMGQPGMVQYSNEFYFKRL